MAKQIKKEIKRGIAKKKSIKYLFLVTFAVIASTIMGRKMAKK